MSLILEALRKSEAERRRGRAPDLSAELPPPPATRRRGSWWWLPAATAAALLLTAALLWRVAPPRAGDGVPRAVAESAENPRREPQPADSRGDTPTAQPPTFPRIERIPAPAETTADPPPSAAPSSEAVAASPPMPTPRADTDARAATPQTPQPTPTAPATTASAPTPSPSTSAPTSAPTAPAAALLAAAPPPIRYSELAQAERQQLPPMKLTLHMWNERPAQRFVIVDGQRYAEGDRIGSGRVAAIDTDGLLIELNGRAVRVPLR